MWCSSPIATSLALLLMCCLHVNAHFRLTFPLPREIDLDFLDNVRTAVPCGVPFDGTKARITTLAAGSNIHVEWHLGYAHRGGLKFFLLTNTQTIDLSGGSWVMESNPTALSFDIQLPAGVTCMATNNSVCTLQVRRQALEWGRNYIFHSCADLNVVDASTFTCAQIDGRVCNGAGACELGECACNDGFSGEACEHEDECRSNVDCGGAAQGECIHTGVIKQCYCRAGWFGKHCDKVSTLISAVIDPADYTDSAVLSPTYSMYWKHLDGPVPQIEIAMKVRTTSWVGLGWKPSNLDSRCQRIPRVLPPGNARRGCRPRPAGWVRPAAPEGGPEATPEGHSRAEPTGEPEHSPEPESTAEAEPETTPEGETHPVTTPEAEAHPETTPESEPEATPEGAHPEATPVAEGDNQHSLPWCAPGAESALRVPEVYSEGCEDPSDPERCSYRASWIVDYDLQVVNFTLSTTENGWVALGVSKTRTMPITDMTIAFIGENGETVIQDSFAERYSTPEADEDGDQSQVTNRAGGRVDGVSKFSYSRACRETNMYDFSLEDTNNYFFFATGVVYVNRYVGMHGMTPRVSPSFVPISCTPPQPTCRPRPKMPWCADGENPVPLNVPEVYSEGCDAANPLKCAYRASWIVDYDLQVVNFTLSTTEMGWVAIGASKDRKMPNTDMTIAWINYETKVANIQDSFAERYSTPEADEDGDQSQITNRMGSRVDGVSTFSYSRACDAANQYDYSLGDSDNYFFFATGVVHVNTYVGMHSVTPRITPTVVKISCTRPAATCSPKPEGHDHPHTAPEGHGEPEGTAEPETTPEGHSEPEGTAEPETTPEGHSEPEGTAEPETTPEGHSEPEGTAEPETTPEGHSEPEGTAEPETTPEGHSEPEGTAEPETTPEGHSEPEGTAEPESTAEGNAVPEHDHSHHNHDHSSPEEEPEPEATSEPPSSDELPWCDEVESYWDTPTGEPEVTAEGEPHGTHHGDYGTAEPEGEPEATAHPEGETTPHAEGEPETTPHAEGEPETTPHAEGEPETTPHAEGEPETTPHAEGEPETTPHAEGEPETTPHAEGEPETTPHAEGEPETTPHAEGEPETTPHAEGEPETTPHAEGAPETTPHAESAPETTPAVETLPPAAYTYSHGCEAGNSDRCQYKITCSPDVEQQVVTCTMSTTDAGWIGLGISKNRNMVRTDTTVGWINDINGQLQIMDGFTEGYFPPASDDDSTQLTATSGSRVNGLTSITFSRACQSSDSSDFSLTDQDNYLIFAAGPVYSGLFMGQHRVTPTITAEHVMFDCSHSVAEPEATVPPATETLPPTESPTTEALPETYSHSQGCASGDSDRCQYKIACTPNLEAQVVECTMSTTDNGWIAFGVSKNRNMANTDTTLAWINGDDGTLNIQDGFTLGYFQPPEDADQSQLTGTSGSRVNGITTIKFSRACQSSDGNDFSLTDGDNYLVFATGPVFGGRFLGQHGITPTITTDYVMFDCGSSRKRRQAPVPAPEAVGRSIHPMDCSDLVIGTARNDLFRMYDAYTRDRSTPRPDAVYGGEDNLLAAVGRETPTGFTEFKFRRRLDTGSPFDHPLTNGRQYFIYAHGQEQNNYHFRLRTGIDVVTASDRHFYKDDQLKYHGFTRNRGSTVVDLAKAQMTVDANLPGFSYGCQNGGCEYKVTWIIDHVLKVVNFTLSTTDGASSWIGLGFSKNRQMPDTDVILAWMDLEGRPVVTDRFAKGYYPPERDADQSQLMHVRGSVVGGVTQFQFSRPCTSSDGSDFSLSDSDNYFAYPKGKVTPDKSFFLKHELPPTFSAEPISIDCSTPPTEKPQPEHTAEPEPEHTAEPEPEHTAEPEPEHTAEPEPEHTAEPEPEHTAEPEPEHTAEPEPEHTAEPEPEHTAEPEPGYNVEPEPEHTAEPTTVTEAITGRPEFCPAIEGCAHYNPPTSTSCCPTCRVMITKPAPQCPPLSCAPTLRCRIYAKTYSSDSCCLECLDARPPPRKNRNVCNLARCPLGSTCADISGVAHCQCKRRCAEPTEASRVCGTDGVTYGNSCMLRRKSCMECLPILIAHAGPCN